jgi:phosphonopyruvate decarboxylase
MTAEKLFKILQRKIKFFAGVPDSLLSSLSATIEEKKINHFISANEGNAVGHGVGYFLAKKKLACVYLQNSGLGNAVNPLISIAHKNVYSIPLLLLIGWRGAPGQKDEPQHIEKGKITIKLLKLLGIKHYILKKNDNFKKLLKLIEYSKKNNVPVACLVKKDVLEQKKKIKKTSEQYNKVLRILFLKKLLEKLSKNHRIISTTGYTSREINHLRLNNKNFKGKDFYMIGGMGHSLSVAHAHSTFSKKSTICIDGDGSLIMHLGSIITCSKYSKNFKYILINNSSHESVGGQPTNSNIVNFQTLSKSIGFNKYLVISKEQDIQKKIKIFMISKGKVFLEVKAKIGSVNNLGRPKNFLTIKKKFISK